MLSRVFLSLSLCTQFVGGGKSVKAKGWGDGNETESSGNVTGLSHSEPTQLWLVTYDRTRSSQSAFQHECQRAHQLPPLMEADNFWRRDAPVDCPTLMSIWAAQIGF